MPSFVGHTLVTLGWSCTASERGREMSGDGVGFVGDGRKREGSVDWVIGSWVSRGARWGREIDFIYLKNCYFFILFYFIFRFKIL